MKKIILLISLCSVTFGFSQMPSTAAPTPPARNASDVISIFCGAYSDIGGVNTNPNWGQSTVSSVVSIAGDNTLQYSTFNYQGTDWAATPQNISTMEYLHIDIWTNAEAPNAYVISSGGEIPHPISSMPGSWQSLDLPVAGITGNLASAIQFKFAGGAGGTIYLDNLYFWKTPVVAGTDATLSDLKVNGTTVTGFAAAVTTYTVGVLSGAAIPQISVATTTDTNATKVITQATAVPGSATVVVTSANGTVIKTYTVNFVQSGPMTPAPTPPARNASDVYSYYSDAYTNLTPINWSPGWTGGMSVVTPIQITGNNTFQVIKGADSFFAGDASAAPHMNLSTFEFMHMDFWTDDTTPGLVLNPKLSQWGGGAGEVNGYIYTNPISTIGQWVSVDIALSSFTVVTNLTDVAQVVFQSNASSIYLDNVYFYKTNLKNAQFELASIKAYPNPTSNVWNIQAAQNITSIKLTNVLGQEVQTLTPNSMNAVINTSALTNGVYLATVTSENGTKVLRLVKN